MQPETATVTDDIVVTEANDFVKLAAGEPADGATAPKQDTTDVAKAAETAPESETGDVKDDKSEHKKGGWQKRIDKLTARNYELEKELETERAKATKPAEKSADEPPKPEGKPKLEDFKTHEEWVEAVADWKIDQRLAKGEQEAVQAEQQARTKEVFDAHNKRVSEALGKYEDFEEKVRAMPVEFSQAAGTAIFELDNGPDVMYHLATHPAEAEALAKLSPIRQIAKLGTISESLLKSDDRPSTAQDLPERPVTKAPPPIKPVGASGAKSTVNEDKDLSDDEWLRQRNKETQGRRK